MRSVTSARTGWIDTTARSETAGRRARRPHPTPPGRAHPSGLRHGPRRRSGTVQAAWPTVRPDLSPDGKDTMLRIAGRAARSQEPLAAKVPEITALFWVVKILTTGIGESTSDFLGQKSVPLAGAIGVFGLIYALRRQLGATQYRAPTYWFAVLMVAVFGTMAAD